MCIKENDPEKICNSWLEQADQTHPCRATHLYQAPLKTFGTFTPQISVTKKKIRQQFDLMQQSSPCYQVSSLSPSPEISTSALLERWSTSMRGCGCHGSCVACAWFLTPPAGRLQTGHRWTPQWICSWTWGEVKQQFSLICQSSFTTFRHLELQLKFTHIYKSS